jgi:hypothetical protein
MILREKLDRKRVIQRVFEFNTGIKPLLESIRGNIFPQSLGQGRTKQARWARATGCHPGRHKHLGFLESGLLHDRKVGRWVEPRQRQPKKTIARSLDTCKPSLDHYEKQRAEAMPRRIQRSEKVVVTLALLLSRDHSDKGYHAKCSCGALTALQGTRLSSNSKNSPS